LAFRLKQTYATPTIMATKVMWDTAGISTTADDIMHHAEGGKPRGGTERDDACLFFRELLEAGPQPASKMMQAGIAEGFKESALNRARRLLGITNIQHDGQWCMILPGAPLPVEDWSRVMRFGCRVFRRRVGTNIFRRKFVGKHHDEV
jgi:hypothetical protein